MPMPVSLTANSIVSPTRSIESRTLPLLGELERVREQVAQDLPQAPLVGLDARGQHRVEHRLERELFLLGERAEALLEIGLEPREHDRRHVDRHRAGLDLGEVEELVDQIEQIAARLLDGLRVAQLGRSAGLALADAARAGATASAAC